MIENKEMMVRRSDNVVSRVIDGEVVLLLPEEASLHALTGCGSQVWELMDGETAVSDVIQRICEEFEVELPRASEEITEFVHRLVEMKLAEIVPAEETSS